MIQLRQKIVTHHRIPIDSAVAVVVAIVAVVAVALPCDALEVAVLVDLPFDLLNARQQC